MQSGQQRLARSRKEVVGSVFSKVTGSWMEMGCLCPVGLPNNEEATPGFHHERPVLGTTSP